MRFLLREVNGCARTAVGKKNIKTDVRWRVYIIRHILEVALLRNTVNI